MLELLIIVSAVIILIVFTLIVLLVPEYLDHRERMAEIKYKNRRFPQ